MVILLDFLSFFLLYLLAWLLGVKNEMGRVDGVQGGAANFANFRDLMIHRKMTSHPVSKIGEQLAQ